MMGTATSGNIHFAYGPGEDGYTQQLQDTIARSRVSIGWPLHGINKSNTLSSLPWTKATTLPATRLLPPIAMA